MSDYPIETVERHIAAPVERIWALLTATDAVTSWYEGWDKIHHDPNNTHLQIGTTFSLSRTHRRRTTNAHCVIVAYQPKKVIGWLEQQPHEAAVLVQFRLEPSPDGGTTIQHTKQRLDDLHAQALVRRTTLSRN
jgi:uncharacterized protein YndB with AHSA1/START domain